MGRYVTPVPVQNRAVKKQQEFKVSGTFTPSQKLLDAGGVVTVRCVGGGGGGHSSAADGGGGSSGMDITRLVTVTAPVTVTIGAGGNSGQQGGSTTFGTLLTALGGKGGVLTVGGTSSGEGSLPGEDRVLTLTAPNNFGYRPGRGGGAGGGQAYHPNLNQPVTVTNASPNTGGGGGGGVNNQSKGGSGLCIVTWEE